MYKEKAEKLIALIHKTLENYRLLKVNFIDNEELKKLTFELIDLLNKYSNIYTKTEPHCISKIESEENKHRALIKELGQLRFSLRKEGEPLFYNLFGVFLKAVAKRHDVSVRDLFFYRLDEFNRLFQKIRVDNKLIDERKRGYALISTNYQEKLLTGSEFKKISSHLLGKKSQAKTISGKTAMAGKATGKVRLILHNKRNISKSVEQLKQGEILVTEMTRPDMVIACQRAAAIITDEGGITCHGAIISREFGIPCIVGTKIATEVFKTGDTVQVNATEGTIKLIKKS